MADRKIDKWVWGALGVGALAYLATRRDGPDAKEHALNGVSGFAGLGGESLPVRIAPDADFPEGLRKGLPGRYAITIRVVDVPLSSPTTPYLSTGVFQNALAQSGIVGQVESVRWLRNGEVSSTNWAADVLDDLFSSTGTGSGTKRAVSDRYFEVTLTLGGNPQSGTGMGGVQIGTAGVIIIVGALAIGIAAFFPSAREAIIEGGRALGGAIGGIVGGAGEEATKGVLLLGLAAVAVIFLAKKAGASVKTSKFSF